MLESLGKIYKNQDHGIFLGQTVKRVGGDP